MKRAKLLIVMTLLITVVFTFSASAQEADWPEVIEMGAIPAESASNLSDRLTPVIEALEAELGVEIKIRNASDYRGVIEALNAGKIDFAKLGPKSYIEAKDNYGGVEPIVKPINMNGSGGYRSCLISNTETDIYTPEGAAGSLFAFNDPNSTSGYLVPMMLFMQQLNVKPEEYFEKVTFSGSHEASILSVANSQVEAASTNLEDIRRAVQNERIDEANIRVIWVSDLIPNDPMVVRSELPESFKTALKEAFLNLPREILVKSDWTGFKEVNDAHYQVIRELNEIKKQMQN